MHFDLFHRVLPLPKGNPDEIFGSSFRIAVKNRKFLTKLLKTLQNAQRVSIYFYENFHKTSLQGGKVLSVPQPISESHPAVTSIHSDLVGTRSDLNLMSPRTCCGAVSL